MKDTKLFQYASFFIPTDKEAKEGAKSVMITEVTTLLARSEQEVLIIASRSIPEQYMDKLNQVTIVVRPF